MIEIELTKGYMTIVDDVDSDLFGYNWYTSSGHLNCPYARRDVRGGEKQKPLWMHRVILERIIGRELKKGELCDHINHNTLDNRRENLRLATVRENAQNRKKPNWGKHPYKNVRQDKNGFYRAVICVDGKTMRVGGKYATPEEAYAIHCQAARHYFGEFANLPDEDKVIGVMPIDLRKWHK